MCRQARARRDAEKRIVTLRCDEEGGREHQEPRRAVAPLQRRVIQVVFLADADRLSRSCPAKDVRN